MSRVRFDIDMKGVRQALSTPEAHAMVDEAAEQIAARCDAHVGTHGFPAYRAHPGAHSHVAIANVSTATSLGRIDNSRYHTLQKEAGIQ